MSTSGCGCSGESLTYECTVMGGPGGATVWIGSALNCLGGEITLLHQRFTNGTVRSCNNGATVAQSLFVKENLYTSQLIINAAVTHKISGKTIMCVYDDMTIANDPTRGMTQFSIQIPGNLDLLS